MPSLVGAQAYVDLATQTESLGGPADSYEGAQATFKDEDHDDDDGDDHERHRGACGLQLARLSRCRHYEVASIVEPGSVGWALFNYSLARQG